MGTMKKGILVLDPRTKILLLLGINIYVFTNSYVWAEIIVMAALIILLLLCGVYKAALKSAVTYIALLAIKYFLLPFCPEIILTSLNIVVITFRKLLPCVTLATLLVQTTPIRLLMHALQRWHLPQTVIIPLAITVRYFPTLREEQQAISDAMKLRNVNLDGYMGAAVALFIVFSGVQLTISTADPLLGQAPEGELVQTITEKMLSYPGIIGMHDLAVHNYGVGRCFASAHCEVDAKNDILVSHDLIDNIERDFSRDLCIHMVIHLDPVIVGDARTDALHRKVQSLVTALYPTVTIHDFRVIWGVTHSD